MDSMLHSSSLVNRDDPIPVLRIPAVEPEALAQEQKPSKRDAIRKQADKIKDKLGEAVEEYQHAYQGTMQERLLTTLMAQIVPAETDANGEPVKDIRSREMVDKPGFSLPLMSYNFRRFNARIGVVFVLQNHLIRLFAWKHATHTLSFLAIYTLVVLEPALLPCIPIALIFFFVMIPSFMARHPPPPPPQDTHSLSETALAERQWEYSYASRPTAPPSRVQPAPEMSKDFFRNMRDLQNSMEDFSRIHDALIAFISPYTDFSDEKTSSAVFLAIFSLTLLATITAHLVPWRLLALISGWSITFLGHPQVQELLGSEKSQSQIKEQSLRLSSLFSTTVTQDINLELEPEVYEVEIFELQRLSNPSSTYTLPSSTSSPALSNLIATAPGVEGEYEPYLFGPSPWDPMSPARLSGAAPPGTYFFEDVAAPRGWVWHDKKWNLELMSTVFVEERCITGVEVETEGERWVYDYVPETYGTTTEGDKDGTKPSKGAKSWEEGTSGRKGQYRRRRWYRMVKRDVRKSDTDE